MAQNYFDRVLICSQGVGERDQEVFHDAVEPSTDQDPSGEAGDVTPIEPNKPSDPVDQDPMEALG